MQWLHSLVDDLLGGYTVILSNPFLGITIQTVTEENSPDGLKKSVFPTSVGLEERGTLNVQQDLKSCDAGRFQCKADIGLEGGLV